MDAAIEFIEERAKTRQVAEENLAAYRRGIEAGHEDYITLATKCDNYYLGDQWDAETKRKLESEGRPALTINAVLAAVNTVLGEQATQRLDIIFKPKKDATQQVAEILSKLTSQVQDNNRYDYVEQAVFADGLIMERGYFDIRIDWEDNLNGEILIESEDPIGIIPDPGAQDYDPKKWKEVTKARWLTIDEIALYYGPEKAKELMSYSGSTDYDFPQDAIRYERKTFGDMDIFMQNFSGLADDKQIRRLLVLERQHYKVTPTNVFADPNTGDTRKVPEDWTEKRADAFAKEYDLVRMRRLQKRVRWTVSAGPTVLHDEWSPYDSFTIVPFFPYFRRGRPMGMVRNLLSPQEQLNKVESQQLHVVNTTANSGWVVEAGSLVNMDESELEERGAETGLVLVYGRGKQPPAKINANNIPTGLDRLGSKGLQNIREIAGVSSMLGVDAPEVSGVALKQKQSRGLVQMQVPFDSLGLTRQLVAEKILELIQGFYSDTRIFRTTDFSTAERESEEHMINYLNAVGEVVNNVTIGEYDVVASTQPARDNFEESQFAEAVQLRDIGVAIPDDVVVEASHLSNKREIAQRIRQQQGTAEPTPQEIEMAMQQEVLNLRMAIADLAEMEAKAELAGANARLSAAKAAREEHNLVADDEKFGAEYNLKLKEQRDKVAMFAENLQNKLVLAGVHTQANREQTIYKETSKRVTEGFKAAANRGVSSQTEGNRP